MNLAAYTATALSRNDITDTPTNKNIVDGAIVELKDLDGNLVVIYDDATGANPETQKSCDANGQLTFWAEVGDYTLIVNGSISFITIGASVKFTRQSRKAIEAVYKAQGYNNVFFFEDGFTYTESNDVGIYEDGTAWTYSGALPVTIAAGTVPSEGVYSLLSNDVLYSVNEFNGINSPNVELKSFHPYGGAADTISPYGGGSFTYRSDVDKSLHDGGRYISPTVPSLSSQPSLQDWLGGTGETDPSGKGVYVRGEQSNSSDSTWYGCSPTAEPIDNATAIQSAWDSLELPSLGEGSAANFKMCPTGMVDIGSTPLVLSGVACKVECEGQIVGNYNGPLITFDTVQQIDIYSPRFRNENFGTASRTLKLIEAYTFNVFGGRLLMNKFLNSSGITVEMQGNAINFYGTVFRYGRRNLLILDGSNRVANTFFGCSFDKCKEGQVEVNQTSSVASQTNFHGGYMEMSADAEGSTTAMVLINNRPKVVLRDMYMSVRGGNRYFEITGGTSNKKNIIVDNCEFNNIGAGSPAFLLRNSTGLNRQLMTINNYSQRSSSSEITISNNAFFAGDGTENINIVNPDFSQDLIGWTSTGNVVHGSSDDVSPVSVGYIETRLNFANSYQLLRSDAGSRYRVTVYAKSAGSGAEAQLSIRLDDLSTVIASSSTTSSTVTKLEVCFATTSNRMALVLRQIGPGSARFSSPRVEKLL